MNEAFPVDDSRAIPISAENAPCAADGDVPVVVDATPRVYKALPNRATKSSFTDLFAPRRRPTAGHEAVPTYKALTEPPADSAEIAETPETLHASCQIRTVQDCHSIPKKCKFSLGSLLGAAPNVGTS